MKKTILLLFLSLSTILQAQSPLEIKKMKGNLLFDGMPDDKEWQNHDPLDFVMYQPINGNEPSERLDVRLCFDEEFLYVGAHLYYEDVSIIQAIGKKRDYDQVTCDYFGIHLDTYFDKQNSMIFYTNPNGLRFDAAVKRDLKYFDSDVNFNWNTYWEVKTLIDDKGWHTEFKIPLSSLRYQLNDGIVTMGLTSCWFIPAKNELVCSPSILPDYALGNWKPSMAQEVFFEELNSKKPLYISPYLLGGIAYQHELNETETSYIKTTTPKFDAGLDLKLGITNNLTLDLTLNTDFAQVEADDQQINLTRYSLFLPEKRVFFQEKADAFDFSMGGPNSLFYSRRIGLDDGEPVRILGGLRLSGRAGAWDVGILDMQTASITNLASENFGVVRLKRTVFNQSSYVGGMFTSRVGLDGNYNISSGFDANIRLFGDEYISVHVANTIQNGIRPDKPMDPLRVQLALERRGEKGLGYNFIFTWSGSDFDPGIGFLRKQNYFGSFVNVLYGWIPNESSPILRHRFYSRLLNYNHIPDRSVETVNIETGWHFEMRSGLSGNLAHNYSIEILRDSLDLTEDVSFSPDRYEFHSFKTEWMLPPSSPIVGMFMTEIGSFYDGWKVSATLMPTWSASPSLDLSSTYRLDRVDIPTRGIGFFNHIIGLKALLTFSVKTSLSAFIQYNTAIDGVIANLRFRYNPREGVDFYLVYNEGLNTYPYSHEPVLPLSEQRTIMAKFTYTFGS
ncbi:MAG: carbohydrate binding family 9 domain-containing protein [Bacteroidetes bacterium]|jgi:hypothetical protein|nr:carbohydrate binding family 9 domain-containing protein [Bacteroidota bacterium]MBT4401254.1 carbohydrate binding family 9 domain-containing protein [Bacteroidota bacterium]MBT4408249.1 carbohydrate binding family 9 domain-containing protein [Bacteroidota bacterium]MBT5427443.1 carbohydrate binding family 9 domain-containing protein [Bacteroidota bacterium]MBT7095688.1 carbohydrate binding family 9 domain-containing protein [Bacteroidota bacterium]